MSNRRARLAFAGLLLLAAPAYGQSMPGMDHSSMPGMDHGSMPGMDDKSMPGMTHGAAPAASPAREAPKPSDTCSSIPTGEYIGC